MKKDSSLIQIVDLLADLTVFETISFDQFINKLIEIIGTIIPTDSCFIYFVDEKSKKLTLIGSKKDKYELLGKISLNFDEGITGWVATNEKTVSLSNHAYKDKRFVWVDELPEDKYEAFLSIPIIHKTGVIGVINLQDKQSKEFSKQDVHTIEMICKIIATAFEKVLLQEKLIKLEEKIENRKLIDKAKGLLMKSQNLSEEDAYQMMRKQAMKQRKTIWQIAEAVILVF